MCVCVFFCLCVSVCVCVMYMNGVIFKVVLNLAFIHCVAVFISALKFVISDLTSVL